MKIQLVDELGPGHHNCTQSVVLFGFHLFNKICVKHALACSTLNSRVCASHSIPPVGSFIIIGRYMIYRIVLYVSTIEKIKGIGIGFI